jgi:hypothetical protein
MPVGTCGDPVKRRSVWVGTRRVAHEKNEKMSVLLLFAYIMAGLEFHHKN